MELDIIEKVLDLQEISTYHCEGVVAFNVPVAREVEVSFATPVRVTDGSGQFLGFAALFRNGTGSLLAEIFLTRESPERLDLEQRAKTYYLVAPGCVETLDSYSSFDLSELVLTPVADRLVAPFEAVARVR